MEEEKAHNLYIQLQSTHQAAKQKRGLGFGAAPTFAPSAIHFVAASDSSHPRPAHRERISSPQRHRQSSSRSPSRVRGSPRAPRGSPSVSPSKPGYKNNHDSDRRQASKRKHRSRSRSHSRKRSRGRRRSRSRKRKRETFRQRSTSRGGHGQRSRSSSRSKERRRSRSRSRQKRRPRSRSRSRSRSRRKQLRRSRSRSSDGRTGRKRSQSHSPRRGSDRRSHRKAGESERTGRTERARDPHGHGTGAVATARVAEKAPLNYEEVIPGYKDLNAAEQLKARMKHQMYSNLRKADDAYQTVMEEPSAAAAAEKGLGADEDRGWTRFVFNKDALLDEEGGRVELDFGREADGAPGQKDSAINASHEDAIFGTKPERRKRHRADSTREHRDRNGTAAAQEVAHLAAQLGTNVQQQLLQHVLGVDSNEDMPVIVEVQESADVDAPILSTAADATGDAAPVKRSSWKERAAALRRLRDAQAA